MYITRISIENIRSISRIEWQIHASQAPGWHVIIGDNGSGKSTFIRAVALALVEIGEVQALRQNWNEWLRKDMEKGKIRLLIKPDGAYDELTYKDAKRKCDWLDSTISMARSAAKQDNPITLFDSSGFRDDKRALLNVQSGCFAASYGPFRRFSGGRQEDKIIFDAYPRLAAHLSAFGESVALTESLEWLRDLQFKKLEGRQQEARLLDAIQQFVNQEGFLPNNTRLSNVSSTGVEFVDGNGCSVPLEELSDGYRSILSMTFELIRQMVKAYGDRHIFSADGTKIDIPGVVLIDEIDAHLHPSWQKRIGFWFREHFPKIQFIVTTHSPLVCQAASVGTVWKLPRPGSDETGGMVTGVELDRLLYGNILDAYGTEVFGENISRSAQSQEWLERLAELNVLEMERDLSNTEKDEQDKLRATLPTSANELAATNGVL
jgi:energy-coupling factor transporter ATP-binding protein EcfA2